MSVESKNTLIKNLKYSIHHATKAYNDAIRVYEAKLVEFGIPPEELGFQPLDTITSTMPAGLVSSWNNCYIKFIKINIFYYFKNIKFYLLKKINFFYFIYNK